MKWLALLCLFVGLLSAMADDLSLESRGGARDYTSRYAELASPVPSHVNVPDLLVSLAAAGRH